MKMPKNKIYNLIMIINIIAAAYLCQRTAYAETIIGSYPTDSDPQDIAISGDYAYIAANGSGLYIVNISDPTNPQHKTAYNAGDSIEGVHIIGRYVYVADGRDGFKILDIADPSNPQPSLSGGIPGDPQGSNGLPGNAHDVFVSGNYAYVASGCAGLQIIDVSLKSQPEHIRGIYLNDVSDANDVYATKVFVNGNFAYVAANKAGLKVADISNPLDPRLVKTIKISSSVTDVFGDGAYIYVTSLKSDGTSLLTKLDIASLSTAGSFPIPGYAVNVYVAGSKAYISSYHKGVQILDVANSGIIDTIDTDGWALSAIVYNGVPYVCEGVTGTFMGIQLYGVDTPEIDYVKTEFDNLTNADSFKTLPREYIEIQGRNFGATQGNSKVLLKNNVSKAEITTVVQGQPDDWTGSNWADYRIICQIPRWEASQVFLAAGTYTLKVIVNGVESNAVTAEVLQASDLNKDGKVNNDDNAIFYSYWLTSDSLADINGDGIANFKDFAYLAMQWKPSAPNNLQAVELTDTQAMASWAPPDSANQTGYVLEYREDVEGESYKRAHDDPTLPASQTIYILSGLKGNTPYDFRCSAVNDCPDNTDPAYSYAKCRTRESENQPPRITEEIEGQSILSQSGYGFKPINLNDHVYDPDTPKSEIIWTAESTDSGFVNNLIVDIDNDNIARIKPMISDWTGSETIKFIADDGYSEASSIATFTIYKSNRTIEELKSKLLNAQTGYGQSGYGVPTALLEPGVYKFTSNLLISRDTVSEAARNSGIIKIIGKDPNPDNTIFELGDYCIDIMEPQGYLGFYQYIPPRFTLTRVIFENITIKGSKKCPSTSKVFIQTGYGQSGYGEGYWKTIEYPYGKAPIHNYASSLILRNCKVIENIGQKASAIYTNRGLLTLENTLIAGNRYPSGSSISGLTVTGTGGSTLLSNTTWDRLDGAIYLDKDAALVVINSTITYNNNQAAYSNDLYGAIAKDANAKVTIQNSVVWHNGSGGPASLSSQRKPIPMVSIVNSSIEVNPEQDPPPFNGYNVSDDWQSAYNMGARF